MTAPQRRRRVAGPRRTTTPAPTPAGTGPAVTDPAPQPGSESLPRALQALGTVVAPATLLTALLLYFGRMHAFGFFDHLGVSYTAMDLTPADYLVRSADGMIPPLALTGTAVLLVLWGRQLVRPRLSERARVRSRRVLVPLLAAVGVGAGVLAVADTAGAELFVQVPELRGLSLCAAVLALLAAARLARGTRPVPATAAVTEWGVSFVLLGVGLFWAVGAYASGVGAGRGVQFEQSLPWLADTTVYSERSLGLTGPGVTVTPCAGPDAGYRFRYDGLKLVVQSGSQFLLLPAGWTSTDGSAVLLPRGGGYRLEFTAAEAARSTGC